MNIVLSNPTDSFSEEAERDAKILIASCSWHFEIHHNDIFPGEPASFCRSLQIARRR